MFLIHLFNRVFRRVELDHAAKALSARLRADRELKKYMISEDKTLLDELVQLVERDRRNGYLKELKAALADWEPLIAHEEQSRRRAIVRLVRVLDDDEMRRQALRQIFKYTSPELYDPGPSSVLDRALGHGAGIRHRRVRHTLRQRDRLKSN